MSDSTDTLSCARHGTATRLRCAECDTPICRECLVKTAVGLKCPEHAEVIAAPTIKRRQTGLLVGVLAVVAVMGAVYGIYQHVLANYHAGPLDFRYESRWATMSAGSRWWAAISESVGPSPTLAPAVLAQAAACLLFATLGHPALASGTAASVQRTRSAAKASSSR